MPDDRISLLRPSRSILNPYPSLYLNYFFCSSEILAAGRSDRDLARHTHLKTISLQFPGFGLCLRRQTVRPPNRDFLSAISTQGDRIMRPKTIVVLTFLLFSISSGHAATQKVLYAFTG